MSEQVILYIVSVLITIALGAVGYVLRDVKDALKSVKEDSAVSISEALERIRLLELQFQTLVTEHNTLHRLNPPFSEQCFTYRARDGDVA